MRWCWTTFTVLTAWSTTSTAGRSLLAARVCSQARCRQAGEHHFGVRPRAGTVTGWPHRPHARTEPSTTTPAESPAASDHLLDLLD